MFNSEKMRKTMLVVMFLELLLIAGLLVNDHIQSVNRLRQQVQALTAQVDTLTQAQQPTATELQAGDEQVATVTETLQSEVKTLKQEVQTLKTEVQQLKKQCSSKPACCKAKCDRKHCPSKDTATSKKPQCGNDKGTTSPPAMHQVEMYFGATKVIVSVPPAIPMSK